MSWTKRGPAAAAPGEQPYAAAPQAQPFGNQQNMYPNYEGSAGNAAPPQQQQYWQLQQPPQYSHQPQHSQNYSQDYPPNANQYHPDQNHYNQNYTNQGYATQQDYHHNYYQNQPLQQNSVQNVTQNIANTGNADGWDENWDWGWEENAKKVQSTQNSTKSQPAPHQVFNNANVIEESFVSTDSWNWGSDDKKQGPASRALPPQQENNAPASQPAHVANIVAPQSVLNNCNQQTQEVKTLNDREVVKERIPNLALGKRFHLENLTPQWSIESQMSQDSSDGPHTQSEGTCRSENQSRNSRESPGPNIDNSNMNYVQSGFNETYTQNSERSKNAEESLLTDTNNVSRRESYDEISNSLQQMSIFNDHPVNKQLQPINSSDVLDNLSLQPPPAPLSTSFPPPVTGSAPVPSGTAQLPPPASGAALPRPSSTPGPPQANFPQPPQLTLPPPSNSQNPFQRAGPYTHKSTGNSAQPQAPADLSSPAVVNKVSQNRLPVGFEANLETTPDNSERPDQPQGPFVQPQAPHSVPDNLEVAPQNDRNEYLQTAHLSSADYGENADFVRSEPPPPGLRRMVVGRRESDYRHAIASGDEPPPGLSRMVPGQQSEGEGAYLQPGDEYPERRGDGQRADRYSQPAATRAFDTYPQYRVVTGLAAPPTAAAAPRSPHVDGADYSEPPPPAPSAASAPAPAQRELTVEGENLQDLSVVSSAELSYSRERLDGADRDRDRAGTGTGTDAGTDGNEASDSAAGARQPPSSRGRARSSGDDTDRDRDRNRAFDASPRRERNKASRDRERNRDREKEGRYSRGTYDREDRRTDRDRRDKDRDRGGRGERRREDASPEPRRADRARRSTRSRKHDEEDAQYCSDRGTLARRHREGSYTSKPPRAGDRDRDRGHPSRRDRDHDRDHDRDRYYGDYREIDPSRKYGNLHHEREDARRRGETYSSASRPESREAVATDEDVETRRSQARTRRPRHHRPDPYYDVYGGYQDPYLVQRQQYSYYEQLRATDPAAYMQVYQQLMAGRAPPAPHAPLAPAATTALRDLSHHRQYLATEGFGSLGSEGPERGSVHSGRSSARLGGVDTELATDASLGLQLDASTVRSDRMTPHRFSTAHVKGSIASRDIVVVPASYPVDGRPATVQLVSLAGARAGDPFAAELLHSPAPLLKGVTHKKSVIEYCMVRVRQAAREGAPDVSGYILVWELLALLLRQNGVVVGSDIAELLMKNTKEYSLNAWSKSRESSHSGSLREETHDSSSPPLSGAQQNELSFSETMGGDSPGSPGVDEKAALDKFREYLLYGNRQEALEWAMSNNLWGHALQLAASGERRVRATVSARFLAALPRADPLHTLYATLAHSAPPHAPCIVEDKWGEWRTHGAMLLANSAARPDHCARALTALGDSLLSRGLPFCAQFCFVSAGVPFGRHPLAPLWGRSADVASTPRLTLLLAAPHATSLAQLATTRAILATEIYEWARGLSGDYVIDELQVYKVVSACRLIDAGEYERALQYVETTARAATRAAALVPPPPRLLAALLELADRLKYHDPLLSSGAGAGVGAGAGSGDGEGDDSGEGSPRHQQWRDDVTNMAHNLQMQSPQPSPLHSQPAAHAWADQTHPYQQTPNQTYVEQEESADYQPPPAPEYTQPPQYEQQGAAEAPPQYQYPEWGHTEESHSQSYGDYWQGDSAYAYGESGETESPRPAISMPAARRYDEGVSGAEQDERPGDSAAPPPSSAKGKEGKEGSKGASWIGGILTKLSLRPPNQMILPDDKNPTIVWDADEKRWRNTAGGDEGVDRPPPPPPPTTAPVAAAAVHDLHMLSSSPPPSGAPSAPVSNIFKMQKGRHIKKSYVDVFNPGGAASRPLPAAGDVLGPPPPAPPAPGNYFVPAPHAQDDMYGASPSTLERYPHSGI